jgi:ubiquinone/menaquinone biosynthesis C-methylase UbiE
MAVGESDAARLDLVDRLYNPSSRAFCESAGMAEGNSVADIGCGHGSMTRWFAEQVGPNGLVYAVDASAQQLEIARGALRDLPQVRFVHARIEDEPIDAGSVDWVYSRFFLMHVSEPLAAVAAMARMLTRDGALLLEMSDIGAMRFTPTDDPAADLWRNWWFALGRALGSSYDIFDRTPRLLADAGLTVQRSDQFQPVSALSDAKTLPALAFEQCVPSYLEYAEADPVEIERHRSFLHRAITDPNITVELFPTTQYLARPRRLARTEQPGRIT